MAKSRVTITSDLDELVVDLLLIAEDFPEAVMDATSAKLNLVALGMKMNWATMIPWARTGDFVWDSIGYNVERVNKDVVGMAGVFKVDHVASRHGREKGSITAPQLAYWSEYGFNPRGGGSWPGIPWMSNAWFATLEAQDKIFADVLNESINMRMKK